jgi:hypothetical protein
MALLQLRGQLVVFELVRPVQQARPVLQELKSPNSVLELNYLVVQQLVPQEHSKYLVTQHLQSLVKLEPVPTQCLCLARTLALVLVELRHLAWLKKRLPADCSGSRSPTLQVQKMDLPDNARTSLRRANHLHQNLVLIETLSAPLRPRSSNLQAKTIGCEPPI